MKLSMSLPEEDVEFLDAYAEEHQLRSRSAALRRAIGALRVAELGDAYARAWDEWRDSGEAEAWESTVADGLVA
jgi:Arc/MetJ-type ribon-helix-helix transcriptional regulator